MRMLKKWLRKLRQKLKNYKLVVSWQLETGEIVYFKRASVGGVWGVYYIEDAQRFRSYPAAREAADLTNAALIEANPMRALESRKVRTRIHSASDLFIGELPPQHFNCRSTISYRWESQDDQLIR